MQAARLLEPRAERTLPRQGAPNPSRPPTRSAVRQGADPRHLSRAGALWRQSRRVARGEPRLFRQGAAPPQSLARRPCSSRCRRRPRRAVRTMLRTPRAPRATGCIDRALAAHVLTESEARHAKAEPPPVVRQTLPQSRRRTRPRRCARPSRTQDLASDARRAPAGQSRNSGAATAPSGSGRS